MSVRWFAVRVAPQKEFDVQRALNQDETPAIVPREMKWRMTAKRHRVKRAYPLFARYVFVGWAGDPLQGYARARANIEEIQGIVCRSRMEWSPLEISRPDVALLHSMAGRELDIAAFEIHRTLKPGGMANIIAGPFMGQTVKIDRVTAKRARVLLNVLNSAHVVEIPVSALDAA